jgi:hypothetical protein
MRTLLCLAFLGLFSSCSAIPVQRSQQSGYADNGYKGTPGAGTREDENNVENKKTAYELGYTPGTTLSEPQLQAIEDRRRLRNLERRLDSQKEKEQYSKILPWLKTDQERIEFLSIPTIEGRQAWVQQKEIWRRSQSPDPHLKEALDENDIAVGMPQDFVRKAWGDPQDKQVSGNPLYKNEKWRYTRYVSSSEGYKKETRNVYFEAGKVVGWETE